MDAPDSVNPAHRHRRIPAAAFAQDFFMKRSKVHDALNQLSGLLGEDRIPYLIAGAMALNEYGYERVTKGIDLILSRAGLHRFKERHLGRGYLEKHSGSKSFRDTENGVDIDVLIAGDYPGDGKPKSVAFPEPKHSSRPSSEVQWLPLPKLIELKLASGMTAPHRLRDLADAIEVIRVQRLDEHFADQLDPMVREKYRELWAAAQSRDPE
jgi:hypothetical protein